jgi:hypothetical protein
LPVNGKLHLREQMERSADHATVATR